MAFPETGILDNFNRDDEGPPPSENWTDGVNGLEVDTNQCAGDTVGPGNNNLSFWNVSTFGPDSECYATIATVHLGEQAWVRLQGAGDAYFVNADQFATPDEIAIYRVDEMAATQLGAAIEQAQAPGDKFGIEAIGDQISAYFDDGGAGWGLLGTRTDATHSGAGSIALNIVDTTARLDDFGGGTVVVARRVFITHT